MTRTHLAAALLVCALGGLAGAQPASSTNHFLVGTEIGAGELATSSGFRLNGSFGSGLVPTRGTSPNFVLRGGFVAIHDAPASGRPWLTAVRPRYIPYHGGTATLHGTALDLGASASSSFDQTPVTVSSRSRDRATVAFGNRVLQPGWQTVSLTNAGGTAVLPAGVGVLPLLEANRAIEIGEPYRITYRGYPGDIVYIAIATARQPGLSIPGYHGTAQLNLGTLISFVGPFPVDSNGVLSIDAPGGGVWSRPVLIQMLGAHTTPGLGLGALTNVLSL